jgi:hypothetical protein
MKSLLSIAALLAAIGTSYAQNTPAGAPERAPVGPGAPTNQQRIAPDPNPATTGAAPAERIAPNPNSAIGGRVPGSPNPDRLPESDSRKAQPPGE